jgi:PAS domain S-box-containing protein
MERIMLNQEILYQYEETKQKLKEMTILFEILKMAYTLPNLDEILNKITLYLRKFFECNHLILYLFNEKTNNFISYPFSQNLLSEDFKELEIFLKNAQTLLRNGLEESSRLAWETENSVTEKGSSTLKKFALPILCNEKFLGVIAGVGDSIFFEENFSIFKVVSTHLASIIENARSEERYRAVVENALDGVMVIGGDDRLHYVNERLALLLGYSREEMIGRDFKEFVGEEGEKLIKDHRTVEKKNEDGPLTHEFRIFKRNGEVRNIEASLTTISASEGNLNTVVFLKDITEKKKMEAQIFQAEKLRAIAEMASGVAHDFNNALSIILGNIQLLQLTVKDPQILETLKIIEKVAKDSSQTVRRLHDFTKGKYYQEVQSLINVNAIIKDVIIMTQSKWKDESQRKGIPIDVVCDLKEIPLAHGNASELKEVISNLIFNAIEAMPKGGKIDIETFSNGSKIYIRISDTGIGMDDETKKRIFEPFYTTKPFTHSGLGLSMSYGIIKSCGGDIEVESQVGVGTTFTISLPASPHKELLRKSTENQFLEKKGNIKAKILVIEDEELIRNILMQGLSRANHWVTLAKDGIEGINLFKEMKFDIVLTDLGMPRLSGWEVCKAIKEISPQTPVGMITGWEGMIDQSEVKEKGPDFILSKPFDFNFILNKIDETLKLTNNPS